MKVTVKDSKGFPLLNCELPEGFTVKASSGIRQYPLNQTLHYEIEAVRDNCVFFYESGENYIWEKKKVQMPFGFNSPQNTNPRNDNGAWYSKPLSLKEDLDNAALSVVKKNIKPREYYDISPTVRKRMETQYRKLTEEFIRNVNVSASFSMVPVGMDIRNYLLDGGMGIYECEDKILAVCLVRMGYECDTLQRAGIMERITGEPFGQASDSPYIAASACEWMNPFVSYMLSDRDEDITSFMDFLDSAEYTPELLNYTDNLRQQVNNFQLEKARNEAMQNQAMWNEAFARQQAGWAASDRLRESISQDLDRFHNNLHAQAAFNDSRFNLGGNGFSYGESSDDRIQRMRHESTMGVETYTRDDGSEVEFDSRADRVFENNLSNTEHFGTEHYYDDFVPDGWHELNKKK